MIKDENKFSKSIPGRDWVGHSTEKLAVFGGFYIKVLLETLYDMLKKIADSIMRMIIFL